MRLFVYHNDDHTHTHTQAVRRMCEDSVEKLSMDSVRKPLDVILPKLIALLGCNDELVKLVFLFTFSVFRIMSN